LILVVIPEVWTLQLKPLSEVLNIFPPVPRAKPLLASVNTILLKPNAPERTISFQFIPPSLVLYILFEFTEVINPMLLFINVTSVNCQGVGNIIGSDQVKPPSVDL